jgi:2-methylisocitrate lyase-like PEP mutase family enzyme
VARAAADLEDIPLVINARIDVFFKTPDDGRSDEQVEETIERAKAYLDAEADCVYPILVGDLDTLKRIRDAVRAPINVYASPSTASMHDLENAGISRLSIGPWMLKAALTKMREVATALKDYEPYDVFTDGTMTTEEVRRFLRDDDMG